MLFIPRRAEKEKPKKAAILEVQKNCAQATEMGLSFDPK
jgi:hypothetical protein